MRNLKTHNKSFTGYTKIRFSNKLMGIARILLSFKPVTNKDRETFLKYKLKTDEKWTYRALHKIFENQTREEQTAEQTYVLNKIGFTGFDAKFLTSIANQLATNHSLSPKQNNILKKIMPKYWKQILDIADREKLDKLTLEWKQNQTPDLPMKI